MHCPAVIDVHRLHGLQLAWHVAYDRGEMHDDPIVFAIKDRASVLIGLLAGLVLALSSI